MKFICPECKSIKYMYKSHVKTNPYICKTCLCKQRKGKKFKYDRSLQFLLEHYRKKFDLPKVQ